MQGKTLTKRCKLIAAEDVFAICLLTLVMEIRKIYIKKHRSVD